MGTPISGYLFRPVNITTKTTTLINTGSVFLGSVVINKTGTNDTIQIYDGVTAGGTLIATITAPTQGMVFQYNCQLSVGLCVVTGGGTAGEYMVTFNPMR